MDKRRTFVTARKNTYASDYISNKRAKIKFSGTSNLANTIVNEKGQFPLITPSGKIKPYQGTYGFSSSTITQGEAPSSYCLNQARSYRDLLDITIGKYLLTPPNPTTTNIQLNQLNISSQLYCGTLYSVGNTGVVSERIICNNSYLGGATGPASVDNKILYNPSTNANQWIYVDPSYNMFYDKSQCISGFNKILNGVNVRDNIEAQRTVGRFLNMNVEGFNYPVKFSLQYEPSNCIN